MIMNSKKKIQVFGETRLEEVNDDYHGLDTDTAKVNVNNIDRTISVDVNFENMIGDQPGQAYPGHMGAKNRQLIVDLDAQLNTETKRLEKTDEQLHNLIKQESLESDYADSQIRQNIDAIETELTKSYATKTYVYEQLASFSKLSKQIAESVDLEANTVTINGVTSEPLDRTLYLVKDESITYEDSYKQYTSIDGSLIWIGTTHIDLSEYAKISFVSEEIEKTNSFVVNQIEDTKEFVNQQIEAIPEVDLTDYAKKSDIPDVSQFISAIPEEYITETELEPYATTEYVTSSITNLNNDVLSLLNNLKFIDGGKAPLV